MHNALTSGFTFRLSRLSGLFLGTYSALPYAALCRVVQRVRPVRFAFAVESSVEIAVQLHRACPVHNRLASGLGRGPVDDLALDWQLHENLKSAADPTMQHHRPVMRRCDCIHDRKSESGPLGIADQ